jgi:ribA/ribD-fused uncharacterized protein
MSSAVDLILDCDALRGAIAAGRSFEYRPFFGHTPRDDGQLSDACFSQWWMGHPFVVGGTRFATAEHFMMAAKARTFGDEETRARILAASEPGAVKALGRLVRDFDEDAWEAVRFDVVTDASVQKFDSVPLRGKLLATGDAILVEAAPRDTIWGVGVGRERAVDPSAWRGLNLLGFALVRARAILRGVLPPVAHTPWR